MAAAESSPSVNINPNNYDPISNLKKQEVKKLVVIVNLNSACLVPGGVDTVLKSGKGRVSNKTGMEAIVENSMDDLSISDERNGVESQSSSGHEHPFGFLNDDATNSNMKNPSSARTKSGNKFARFGAKLKNQFDRGVTSIAVQAQKATTGDNTEIRDLLTVGAYVEDKQTGEFNICIGMTERVEMPDPSLQNDSVGGASGGLTFTVPIQVPLDTVQSNVGNATDTIQFHLWMRSGAAIFAKNRALRKYVFVGTSTMHLAELTKQMQPKIGRPFLMTMPLQSSIVPAGKMNVLVLPDTKFPNLCGSGWSLCDPRTDTAYNPVPGKKIIFNPPLDSNYAFATRHSPLSTILATERLTESTIVLPTSTSWVQLLTAASAKSVNHARNIATTLQFYEGADTINPMTAMQQGHAQCQIEIFHFLRYPNGSDQMNGGGAMRLTLSVQRPDSIFENCIASACSVPSHPYVQNMTFPSYHPAASVPFYQRIVKKTDPRLLPGQLTGIGLSERDVFLGKVRIQLYEEGVGGAGVDLFSPIGPAGTIGTNPRHLEALIDIDSYLNAPGEKGIVHLNVIDVETGQIAGILAVTMSAQTLEGMVENSSGINGSIESDTIDGGLISLVGMDTLMEDDKACYPHSDLNTATERILQTENVPSNDSAHIRRRRQLATMGEFLTFDYILRHVEEQRSKDHKDFQEKKEQYSATLNSQSVEGESILSPDKQKEPRPFRPSSSRLDSLLSAIGFNVHVQSFCISAISADTSGAVENVPQALFQNVTCGAPAAHERGFSPKGGNKEKDFSGGLRRLEENRRALAAKLRDIQDRLIDAVGIYYSSQSKSIQGRSSRHIPPGEHSIASIRAECISITQTLHNLTWEIAARRSTVFPQALGIAITLFLAHISDLAKLQKAAWAELWMKHGFLITFEGLLSSAGKELGMIEDAAVGIAMLRMVSVIFVTESAENSANANERRVFIKDSSYLKWLQINPSGTGSDTRYLVELCVDPNYYSQRIPPVLHRREVRFYPVLYQMGVDIRQWGANAGANFGKSKNENNDEMDEDEVGVPDNDFLLALNFEAFRKMNAYAHEVFLCADPQKKVAITWEEAHSAQQMQQPIHPMLTSLYEFIRSSAGKMEHGILDEAGFASNRLGGGSGIFCKSGKDRTAMQVTFKQSQFLNKFMTMGNGFAECDVDPKKTFYDANKMRVYGTRLPICDKNVGQSLYAFNALQAKFMPEILKPPSRALAGFLKGGRVFSGGGIES